MLQKYKWTGRLTLYSLPLMFFAIILAGGGHGTIIPAIFLFPFAVLSFPMENEGIIFLLALGQFTFYGWMIDKFKNPRQREILIYILGFIHLIVSFLIFRFRHGMGW